MNLQKQYNLTDDTVVVKIVKRGTRLVAIDKDSNKHNPSKKWKQGAMDNDMALANSFRGKYDAYFLIEETV